MHRRHQHSGREREEIGTAFLKDMGEFAAMNEVYARYFSAAPPARATVEVARLPATSAWKSTWWL